MKAVIIEKSNRLMVTDIPKARPRQDEVLMAVAACGICGSDIRYLHGENPWARQTLGEESENPPNMPLGHEFAGTIVEVGNKSFESRIGQRVAALAYKGCGECHYCRVGKHHICGEVKHIGHSAGWDQEEFNPAGMAEYCRVWNDKAFKLPDSITFEQATLLDGLAVAIHACSRGNVRLGESVLIIGSGVIGLLVLQVARNLGAKRIVCCDKHPAPLSVAKELGADSCFQTTEWSRLRGHQTCGEENLCDAVFDSVGSTQTVKLGLESLKRGGRVVLLAMADNAYSVSSSLFSGERTLTSSANNGYPDFQNAVDMLGSGRIIVDPLITHQFSFEKAQEAFDVAENKETHGALKVVLKPG